MPLTEVALLAHYIITNEWVESANEWAELIIETRVLLLVLFATVFGPFTRLCAKRK